MRSVAKKYRRVPRRGEGGGGILNFLLFPLAGFVGFAVVANLLAIGICVVLGVDTDLDTAVQIVVGAGFFGAVAGLWLALSRKKRQKQR